MDLQLRDKVCLVAGGSSGLGYATALELCREGARVLLLSRDGKRVADAARAISSETGADCRWFAGDVRCEQDLSDWIDLAVENWGHVDTLLVNAGGPPKGHFGDLVDEYWQEGFELTLLSAVRMIRLALPHLKKSPVASILTVTSNSIREPIDFLLLSNVMRSGVLSLVKSLSRDFAVDGIRVNNLVPGFIATERMHALEEVVAKDESRSPEEQRALFLQDIPMERYGEPAEFGRAAAFLLSPAASYITGASLSVDGGRLRGVW